MGQTAHFPPFSLVIHEDMKMLLSTLFGMSFVFAVLSVVALFLDDPTSLDIGIAVGSVVATVALYAIARWYLIKFGRIGLLKPKLFRKEQSKKIHKDSVALNAANTITSAMHARMNKLNTGDIGLDMRIRLEMQNINALGFDRKQRTFEELQSESAILAFVEVDKEDRSSPPLHLLSDIRETAPLLRLRTMVDDWYAERENKKSTYQAWLAEVGDVDQSHLLRDGWIAFLENLPGPDIHLWHGIATDFHGMSADRLNAAFWIVEKDACDRTTASEFIMGFLQARLDIGDYDTKDGKQLLQPDPLLDRFASVVVRYNRVFYRFQSIPAGIHAAVSLEDGVADSLLTFYERATGLTGLPRPKGIIADGTQPTDPTGRGHNSGYAFWSEAGLHLAYPGDNQSEAS